MPGFLLKAKGAISKGLEAARNAKAAQEIKDKIAGEEASEKVVTTPLKLLMGLSALGCAIVTFFVVAFVLVIAYVLVNAFWWLGGGGSETSSSGGSFSDWNGTVTSQMEKVVEMARQEAGAAGYDNLCEKWVEVVWEKATGITRIPRPSAWDAFQIQQVSTSKDNIPPGAAVYASGWPYGGSPTENPYGHVGIYLGNGEVADYMKVWNIDEWLNQQQANCNGHIGWLGWGWVNNVDLTQS